MFDNLGLTLSLLRELRGKSQARMAREASIGKSQLSKYENGKELPKLDSLEKLLNALQVSHFEFFYTLYLIDRRSADLAVPESTAEGWADVPAAHSAEASLYMPAFAAGNTLLGDSTDEAFRQVFAGLLQLYRRVLEQTVLSGARASDDFKPAD
jgi:transcriptional regulator with XRE-family HTH domain